MSTTTPVLGLTLYDSTTDQAVTFATFRAVWGGTPTTSNFYKIDTWAGTVNSSITALQNARGAITVNASYISANYYEATVATITTYTTGMNILLSLDADSAGTVTLNISSLGIKSVTKVNSSGTIVNISAGELQAERYYLFTYDGTQWVWVNGNSSDQIYLVSYVTGNVLTAASDGSIDATLTQSLMISQTVNSATAKTTLADADVIPLDDSVASNVLKKITWANFKTAIGTGLGTIINALTGKTTPVGADVIGIGDSASSFASKQVLLSNLYKAIGTGTQSASTFLNGAGAYATPDYRKIKDIVSYSSGSGTYTPSAGTTAFLVEVVGAGGGAGGCDGVGSSFAGAAGGGSGGFAVKLYTSPLSTYSYSIGTGGSGGDVTGSNGSSGGSTTFDVITCTGGAGGEGQVASTTAAMTAGGLSGGASGGDYNYDGNAGSNGIRISGTVGSGGGGGASFYGGQGRSRTQNGISVAGQVAGAGASGGATTSTTDRAGADGANGQVVIYEFGS